MSPSTTRGTGAILARSARTVVDRFPSVRAHFSPCSRAFVRRSKPRNQKEARELARETLITPEGLEKLKEELEYLETDKRREVADRIKQAREFGDIAENYPAFELTAP